MRFAVGFAVLAAALAAPAMAQVAVDGLAEANGAVLRGLDKVAGASTDLPVQVGTPVQFGQLTISLQECRYPANDPASNAYAFLTIQQRDGSQIFSGWMIASSPALSALDHPRYDVWVVRCKSS